MSLLWKELIETYTHAVHTSADPRTKEWLLVASPWNPLLVMICYAYFCLNVRQITSKMPTYQLKPLIICYNAMMVALSCYMTYEFVVTAYLGRYSLICQPVDLSSSGIGLRMANICWLYYFSKYIELMETGIFALRKKFNQISVLHVYHHSSMIFLWWIMLKYAAGGQAYIFGTINSFVHTVMYTYYGLSALGPWIQKYLWWKKYITMLQLSQFVYLFFFCIQNLVSNCRFPRWICNIHIGYAVTLFTLFFNFYKAAYAGKKSNKSPSTNDPAENGSSKRD